MQLTKRKGKNILYILISKSLQKKIDINILLQNYLFSIPVTKRRKKCYWEADTEMQTLNFNFVFCFPVNFTFEYQIRNRSVKQVKNKEFFIVRFNL